MPAVPRESEESHYSAIEYSQEFAVQTGELSEDEFRQYYRHRLAQYYRALAAAAVESRDRAFWEFHRRMLGLSGAPLRRMRLATAIAAR